MPRVRDNPQVLRAITTDRVTAFGVSLAYTASGVDTSQISFEYVVENIDGGGQSVNKNKRQIPFAQWPAALKSELKSIFDKVLVDAENQGLIGPGVDTDDLP